MDASLPKIRRLRATPVNVPLARPHPTASGVVSSAPLLNERLVHRALSLDGTCTGEHGIGCGKIDFLLAEHGEATSTLGLSNQL